MELDALNALEDEYDIIIIGARPPWKAYPQTVRNAIIGKVKAGTSLIIFGSEKEVLNQIKESGESIKEISPHINKFAPVEEKPAWNEKYYRYLNSSIAVLNNQFDNRRGYLVSRSKTCLHYEYKYRRIASLIYKLSKKIDDWEIQSVEVEKSIKAILRLKPAETGRSILFKVKDQFYETTGNNTIKVVVEPGTSELSIDLPDKIIIIHV